VEIPLKIFICENHQHHDFCFFIWQMQLNDIPVPTMDEVDNKLQELQNSKNYSYQDNDVDKVLWRF
jgi:hypothetical protein